jgi:hypothetical protein
MSNILLITAQRPGATRVAGYQTWRKLHRHVTRGSKGIIIFAPLVRNSVDTNECGVETRREILLGYRTAVVFDVADTEGSPMPEFSKFDGNPGEYLGRLKMIVTESGCSLEYSTSILPARGQCSAEKIVILPDLSPAEEFHVLSHELAHSRLHFSPRRAHTTRLIRETEAEAIAFVVSQAIGLDTNSASADYLKLYDSDPETLAQSLEHTGLAEDWLERRCLRCLFSLPPASLQDWVQDADQARHHAERSGRSGHQFHPADRRGIGDGDH